MVSYSNGVFVSTEAVSIPLESDILGSIRGLRIFTTSVVVNGKVVRGEDHVDRLLSGAARLELPLRFDAAELMQIIQETVSRNSADIPFVLKVIVSGEQALTYVIETELALPPLSLYESGASVATFAYQRALAEVKMTHYLGSFLAKPVMKKYHADFSVFVTLDEPARFLEGDTFNVFFVKAGRIFTPPATGNILRGLTRQTLLDLTDVTEAEVRLDSLVDYDEMFLTSSIRQVMPIVKVNGQAVGSGRPGPVARRLLLAMQDRTGLTILQ